MNAARFRQLADGPYELVAVHLPFGPSLIQ
jgi:hypothetical protein